MRDVAMALAEGVPLPRYVKESVFGPSGEQLPKAHLHSWDRLRTRRKPRH